MDVNNTVLATKVADRGMTTYSPLQQALLTKLEELTPNLTTYQSGAKAPSQIISKGKYVLKDTGEIKKFQTDLEHFIKGSDSKNPRIKNLEDITAEKAHELLEFLKSKGYKERNIQDDFRARTYDPAVTRENLGTISKPSKPTSIDTITESIIDKLNDPGFVPEINRLAVPGGDDSYMQVGQKIKDAFTDLILGDKTFSPELIKNIAKQETKSRDGAILHQDTKADGGNEHIALILERFLDLQTALEEHFQGNKPALTKIEAAMTNEQFDKVIKALDVRTL